MYIQTHNWCNPRASCRATISLVLSAAPPRVLYHTLWDNFSYEACSFFFFLNKFNTKMLRMVEEQEDILT